MVPNHKKMIDNDLKNKGLKNILSITLGVQFKMILVTSLLVFTNTLKAQVGIGIEIPDTSTILHIENNGEWKGILPPRVDMGSSISPTKSGEDHGLLIYDTVFEQFYYHRASDDKWLNLGVWDVDGNEEISINRKVSIGTTNKSSAFFKVKGNVEMEDSLGVGKEKAEARLDINGDILLKNSEGDQKEIYTFNISDDNWRIGLGDNNSESRVNTSLFSGRSQYITYANTINEGFVLGPNNSNSGFELRGGDHRAFFRGNVSIGTSDNSNARLHVTGLLKSDRQIIKGFDNPGGNVVAESKHDWYIHAPADNRDWLIIAPNTDNGSGWDWGNQLTIKADGELAVAKKLTVGGNAYADEFINRNGDKAQFQGEILESKTQLYYVDGRTNNIDISINMIPYITGSKSYFKFLVIYGVGGSYASSIFEGTKLENHIHVSLSRHLQTHPNMPVPFLDIGHVIRVAGSWIQFGGGTSSWLLEVYRLEEQQF